MSYVEDDYGRPIATATENGVDVYEVYPGNGTDEWIADFVIPGELDEFANKRPVREVMMVDLASLDSFELTWLATMRDVDDLEKLADRLRREA